MAAQHLFGLVCERIGHVDLAIDVIGRAITLLEGAYEETEDPEIERQFAIAHINMARLRLGSGDLDQTQDSCQVVLGLLGETEDLDEATAALLAQAQLCSGLANMKQGNFSEALETMEKALATSANMSDREIGRHIAVIIAQTLWTIGTADARDAAKTRLLQRCATCALA